MGFAIKTGDEKPHITATLSGGPSDWTGASAEIVIKPAGGTATAYSCTLDDSAKTVEFDWTGFDTTSAGFYTYEWRVTFADGDEMTAPGCGVSQFQICASIDD